MLVLARKYGESIVIQLPNGRLATVMVIGISPEVVRLGITADRDIRVDRKEVVEKRNLLQGEVDQ